jgi:hypothetical protein
MELLILVALLSAFGLLAARFGADSREGIGTIEGQRVGVLR